jgi:N-acetylglucosamine malate deacetylase 1
MPNHNPYYNPSVAISRRALLSSMALPLIADEPARPLKIVVAGGHPGDPECGCAGTIARYTDLGHHVSLLYLNRGEGYCGGAELARCGAIRTTEGETAAKILRANATFAGQTDGKAIVDDAHYDGFTRTLSAEKPDVVFTHWPIDRHRDHRALSMLVLDAWLKRDRAFALYFYEVAEDTMMFRPDDYVDISTVEARRRAACYAHASQQPDKWYPKQVAITRFRGTESGFPQAEAFARHPGSRRIQLP